MPTEKSLKVNAILEYETDQLTFCERMTLAVGLVFGRNIRLRVRQFTVMTEAAEAAEAVKDQGDG